MTTPRSTYNVSFQPPPPFHFSSPDERPKWRRRFEQFRVVSGLRKEDEETQVSTLLHCLGDDADNVLTSTNIAEENCRNMRKCLENSTAILRYEKNVIFERACFNARFQGEGESIE